jgi:hypothetical protein
MYTVIGFPLPLGPAARLTALLLHSIGQISGSGEVYFSSRSSSWWRHFCRRQKAIVK